MEVTEALFEFGQVARFLFWGVTMRNHLRSVSENIRYWSLTASTFNLVAAMAIPS